MSRTRQLAAIMFTDIQGYTALMQQSEAKAIAYREKHRQIFNSLTEKFNGKILQYYGDGTLSIFTSAIEAVKCGIAMQLAFLETPSIPVRIGIHLGDIVLSEEEIIGDGVNVASRIESLAQAGSIYISDKIHDEIKNQETIKTVNIGPQVLKNVANPIEVYAIANEGLVYPGSTTEYLPDAKAASLRRSKKQPPNLSRRKKMVGVGIFFIVITAFSLFYSTVWQKLEPAKAGENSIAVLAFENMSGDENQEYFSDGISEEILNVLTRVEGLKVAGRTSAFAFKHTDKDIREIGKELGVSMVLEGSVRKSGEKLRVTAQLINVDDGFHIWSENYDREMEDIFAIQDEIALKVVDKLKLHLATNNENKTKEPKPEAYDLVLKGNFFLNKDYEGTLKAMEYFQKAVEIDSTYAFAYAMIGDAYTNFAAYGFMSNAEAYQLAIEAAERAIQLNYKEARAYKILAYANLYYKWDWEASLAAYKNAIKFGLSDPDHFITFYDIFLYKNYENAISVSRKILEKDQLQIESHWHLGFCLLFAGDFTAAEKSFKSSIELDPNYSEGYRYLGISQAYLGKFDLAEISLKKALEITGGKGPAQLDLLGLQIQNGNKDHVIKQLENMIYSDESIDPSIPAVIYAQLGMPEKTLEWLEKCYEQRSLVTITLKAYWIWDPFRNLPEFKTIYEKMNFPV